MLYSTQEIQLAVIDAYGFDPFTLHCQATGKPIGTLLKSEIEEVCANLSGITLEEIADDIAMRSICSVRPSMKWNRLGDRLDDLRQSAPNETLAYLLNLLFDNDKLENYVTVRLDRLKIYSWVSTQDNKAAFDLAMLQLLEIHAKLNLKSEYPPFTCEEILANHMGYLVDALEPWVAQRIIAFDKAEREARFFAANPGAKRAFAKAWFETAPKSESTVKREAKQSESNLMTAILAELMGTGADKPAAMRTTLDAAAPTFVKPTTKMPTRFGTKQAAK